MEERELGCGGGGEGGGGGCCQLVFTLVLNLKDIGSPPSTLHVCSAVKYFSVYRLTIRALFLKAVSAVCPSPYSRRLLLRAGLPYALPV